MSEVKHSVGHETKGTTFLYSRCFTTKIVDANTGKFLAPFKGSLLLYGKTHNPAFTCVFMRMLWQQISIYVSICVFMLLTCKRDRDDFIQQSQCVS